MRWRRRARRRPRSRITSARPRRRPAAAGARHPDESRAAHSRLGRVGSRAGLPLARGRKFRPDRNSVLKAAQVRLRRPLTETHELAERKQQELATLRQAWGLGEVVEGQAFDRELQARRPARRPPACAHGAAQRGAWLHSWHRAAR